MTEQLVEAMDTAPTISMREAKDLLAKSQSQAFDLVCSLRTFEETHGWKHITDRTGEYYRSFKDFISGEFKTSQANYLTQKFRQETIAQVEAIKPPALDISGNSAVHLSARLPEDQASQKKVLEKAAEMFPDARLTTKHIDAESSHCRVHAEIWFGHTSNSSANCQSRVTCDRHPRHLGLEAYCRFPGCPPLAHAPLLTAMPTVWLAHDSRCSDGPNGQGLGSRHPRSSCSPPAPQTRALSPIAPLPLQRVSGWVDWVTSHGARGSCGLESGEAQWS